MFQPILGKMDQFSCSRYIFATKLYGGRLSSKVNLLASIPPIALHYLCTLTTLLGYGRALLNIPPEAVFDLKSITEKLATRGRFDNDDDVVVFIVPTSLVWPR